MTQMTLGNLKDLTTDEKGNPLPVVQVNSETFNKIAYIFDPQKLVIGFDAVGQRNFKVGYTSIVESRSLNNATA